MSIYITQLVYVNEGAEAVFQEFEDLAIPLIGKHHGKLLVRIRPGKESIVESNIEIPYEVHVVEFDSVEDFERFKEDPARKAFLHLKDRSVRSVLMIKGEKI